jgi:hypothetical protein
MRHLITTLALLSAFGLQLPARADILSVRAVPVRSAAIAGQDLTLGVTWQVTLEPTDIDGARSAAGIFVNAASGAPLGLGVPTTLGSITGGGVQIASESVSIPGATLDAWYRQGVRRIGYRRAFISPRSGRAVQGQWLIDLSRSSLEGLREAAPGELRVLRMELQFASGKRVEIAPRAASLVARLTLSYSGGGTLRGRWQVAEPGGGANPFFRTVSLVRATLAPTQRATLESPRLPTQSSGRYALRFCLDAGGANPDEDCADSSAGVQTIYEVSAPAAAAITMLAPAGGSAGPASIFRWTAVPGASLYQLQIMIARDGLEPQFVTGLLLPGLTAEAALSQLVISKLVPGSRYRWRVTAHDANGGLLARSDSEEFVYRP